MEMDVQYKVIQMNEDTWRIEEPGVRFFVLKGTERALLIDSGMMVHNAKEIAGALTSLSLELLNTHADMDHVGSNHEFAAPYMNPAELSNYHNTQGKQGDIKPVWDGDKIELGERTLKIIALPGHTPGGIAVLDEKYHALFSGDPIQNGDIFMFGVQRDLRAYRHSLLRLKDMKDYFSEIYPSHGAIPVSKSMIDDLIKASEEIMEGSILPEDGEFHGIPLKVYEAGGARFLCDVGEPGIDKSKF
mgnify:CR=1 FL=1